MIWKQSNSAPSLTSAILGYEGISKESVSAPFTVRSSISLMTAQTGSSHRITAELCCKIQVTVTHTRLAGTPRNIGTTEIAISTPEVIQSRETNSTCFRDAHTSKHDTHNKIIYTQINISHAFVLLLCFITYSQPAWGPSHCVWVRFVILTNRLNIYTLCTVWCILIYLTSSLKVVQWCSS